MKGSIKKRKGMVKGPIFIVMGINMLVNGKKEKKVGREFIIIKMGVDMKENI